MTDEPALVDNALQRGHAPLKPVLHFAVVADDQRGSFGTVTHGAPPRGTGITRRHTAWRT